MLDDKLKKAIDSAVKSGKFGENLSLVDVVPSSNEGEDQFASDVIFAKVKLQNSTNQKEVRVVIKRQQKLEAIRAMMNSDLQFYNEHLMYSEILPFLEKKNVLQDIFPKYYHSCATLGEDFEEDVVVVEDLKQYGFKLSEEKVFLDFDHCVLALEALGKFHALSYAIKQENAEKFLEKVKKLKEIRWETPQTDDTEKFMTLSMERGVLPLIEAGESVPVLEKFIKKVESSFTFGQDLVRPEEPSAVICHGDFNRNNVFFKYNNDGKPVSVKLFDIATARYASPAIDLAFFFFMNTTAALRASHWDELLRVYHDALTSTVPECQVLSLEDVHTELQKKGVYGYLISSFFIPMMLDNTKKEEMEDYLNLTPEEGEEMARNKGGVEVTRILTDVVRDLVKIDAL